MFTVSGKEYNNWIAEKRYIIAKEYRNWLEWVIVQGKMAKA